VSQFPLDGDGEEALYDVETQDWPHPRLSPDLLCERLRSGEESRAVLAEDFHERRVVELAQDARGEVRHRERVVQGPAHGTVPTGEEQGSAGQRGEPVGLRLSFPGEKIPAAEERNRARAEEVRETAEPFTAGWGVSARTRSISWLRSEGWATLSHSLARTTPPHFAAAQK